MRSIHSLIIQRFFVQSFIPFVLILATLAVGLYLFNNYQKQQNQAALASAAIEVFAKYSSQTAQMIARQVKSDKLLLEMVYKSAIFDAQRENLSIKESWININENLFIEKNRYLNAQGFFNVSTTSKLGVFAKSNEETLQKSDIELLHFLESFDANIKNYIDSHRAYSQAWVTLKHKYYLYYPPISLRKAEKNEPRFMRLVYQHAKQMDTTNIELFSIYNEKKCALFGLYVKPIYWKKRFIGAMAVELKEVPVNSMLKALTLPFNGYVNIIDNNNNLLATSNEEGAYNDFHAISCNQKIKENNSSASIKMVAADSLDDNHLIIEHLVEGTQWKVQVIAKKSDVFASVEQVSKHVHDIAMKIIVGIIGIYIFIIIINVIVLRRLANYIAKPLEAVATFSSTLGMQKKFALRKSKITEIEALNENLLQTHEHLLFILSHDETTKLPNRRQLDFDLKQAVGQYLMLVNISNFRSIQSFYGSKAVVSMIIMVAKTLDKEHLVKVYRIGDDMFALLCHEESQALLETLFIRLRECYSNYNDIELHPFAFAGMCQIEDDETAIENATMALERAKESHALEIFHYNELIDSKTEYRQNVNWAGRLKKALEEDRIEPYFQPIMNVHTNKIEKFESLVRINEHNQIISPLNFLTIAKHMGRTHEITRVMIDKSFEVASHFPAYEFTFNISFLELQYEKTMQMLILAKEKYHIDPEKITIEFLEYEALQHSEDSLKIIKELKTIGYKIAIDDFGTGHSNFTYFAQMNIDIVKIDGQFVQAIDKDPKSAIITRTIARFAHQMGAKCVAEHVSSDAILKRAKKLEVDFVQGYAISQPIPAYEIDRFVKRFSLHQ